MAELRESIMNPVELSNKLVPPKIETDPSDGSDSTHSIPAGLVKFVDKPVPNNLDADSDVDSDTEHVSGNKLDEYYLSLSDMLDDIYTNHLLLTKSINDTLHTVATLKLDINGMRDTYIADIEFIKKEIDMIKRMIHDNRNTFLLVLEKNNSTMKARVDKLEASINQT